MIEFAILLSSASVLAIIGFGCSWCSGKIGRASWMGSLAIGFGCSSAMVATLALLFRVVSHAAPMTPAVPITAIIICVIGSGMFLSWWLSRAMNRKLLKFLHNVKEHAPPLAGASVETGIEVHTPGDVYDKAASGGCCVSTCSTSSIRGSSLSK